MKKLLLVLIVALLAAAGGAYYLFINQHPVEDPAFIEAAVTDFETKWNERQASAQDSEKNGFLHPELVSYWGEGAKSDAPVSKEIENWNRYGTIYKAGEVNHSDLQANGDEAYMDSFRAFEPRVPQLVEALQKPQFIGISEKPTFDGGPNYSALLGCSGALSGFVEYKLAEGIPSQTLDPLKAMLSVGKNLPANEQLLAAVVGHACQRYAANTVAMRFTPDTKMSDQEWARLSKIFWKYVPPGGTMPSIIKSELVGILASIGKNPEMLQSSLSEVGEDGPIYLKLPGAGARELRIFKNQLAPMLKSLDEGKIPELPTGEGIIAAIVLPTYDRFTVEEGMVRKQVIATAIATSIVAFKKATGEYPKDLHALTEIGAGLPKEMKAEDLGVTYKAEAPVTLSIALDAAEVARMNESRLDRSAWWGQVKGEAFVFTF